MVGNSDGDRRNSSVVGGVVLNDVADDSDESGNSNDGLEGARMEISVWTDISVLGFN